MMKMMKRCLLPVVVLGSLLLVQPARAADSKSDGDWKTLFNGKDFTGWVVMNAPEFSVTNGLIHLGRGSGWLRTEKEYTDFILEAEWRPLEARYNSGFFVRTKLEGKPFPPDAWQVNLKEAGVGELLIGSANRVPSVTPAVPLNQWVKFRIEARGKKLTLDVDGKRAWEFNELEPARGYIGLQSEGKSFDFRNLRLQELGASSLPASK